MGRINLGKRGVIMNSIRLDMPTTYEDLKESSKERMQALCVLYNANLYHTVVADSGYPAEFGLKAVICRNLNRDEYPSENRYKKHKLNVLVNLCHLNVELEAKKVQDEYFAACWLMMSGWDVPARYMRTGNNSEEQASDCIEALTQGGILDWIEEKW